MFFSRTKELLAQSEAENRRLQDQAADLQRRLTAAESERDRLSGEVAGLASRAKIVDGVVQNLGSFSTSLTGIRGSFLGLSSNLNQQQQSAESMAAGSQVSRGSFEALADNLKTLYGKISTASTSVEGLFRRAEEIGGIVLLIKDVADQTNLLSLNAAIEAARAGESGRGFAVVADEVRKLADRTARATAEISTLVTAIQADTRQARDTMQTGAEDAERFSSESEGGVHKMQHLLDMSNGMERAAASSALLSTMELANIEELMLKLEVYKVFLGVSDLRPEAVPDQTKCRLGQWYYGEGREHMSNLRGFDSLEAPHKDVHNFAREALTHHYAGRHEDALRALTAMERANLTVMSGIERMLAAK